MYTSCLPNLPYLFEKITDIAACMREFADSNLQAPPLPGAEFGLVTRSLQFIPLVGGNWTCDLDHRKSSVDVHIQQILFVFCADLIAVCGRHIRGWRVQTPRQVDHQRYVGHTAPARPLLRLPRGLALACICSRPVCKDGGFNVHKLTNSQFCNFTNSQFHIYGNFTISQFYNLTHSQFHDLAKSQILCDAAKLVV